MALDVELVAKEMPERVRYVAVQHDVERQLLGDALGEPALDAFSESGEPLIRRRSAPAQGERDVVLGIDDIERNHVITDRARQLVGIDRLSADKRRQQYLQIAPRQQFARRRNVAGIAGQLHAVFRGAEGGRANTFAGREHRPRQVPLLDTRANGPAKAPAKIAEVAILTLVDVFGDAAGN